MILKASQRSGAAALADHLMNSLDNDHIELLETRGFMAEDLHGAFAEAYAISKATRCRQYLFSLSLNPPQDHVASEDQFLKAAERIEDQLSLSGQPRAIVIHEKEGRRHAHVVWSRINGEELKAINLPHFKNKLRDMSKELFLDHGWELPKGLQSYGAKAREVLACRAAFVRQVVATAPIRCSRRTIDQCFACDFGFCVVISQIAGDGVHVDVALQMLGNITE
jgi:hypothetical protein